METRRQGSWWPGVERSLLFQIDLSMVSSSINYLTAFIQPVRTLQFLSRVRVGPDAGAKTLGARVTVMS